MPAREAAITVLVGILLLPVQCAFTEVRFLNKESWAALSASEEVVKAEPEHACARLLRVACANVDITCSDESPVYRLDTDAKKAGKSGQRCRPWIFAAGHASSRLLADHVPAESSWCKLPRRVLAYEVAEPPLATEKVREHECAAKPGRVLAEKRFCRVPEQASAPLLTLVLDGRSVYTP